MLIQQREASDRHPLAGDCCRDRVGVMVESQCVLHAQVAGTGSLQPRPPIHHGAIVRRCVYRQQCVMGKIGGLPQRMRPVAQQRWRTDRQNRLGKQRRLATAANRHKAHCDIDLRTRQVKQIQCRRNAHVHLWVICRKPRQSWNQPDRRKARRGRDRHLPKARRCTYQRCGVTQALKAIDHRPLHHCASFRQQQRPMPPHEQGHAEPFFELLNLPADCGLGEKQLLRRLRKAQRARCSFKSAQQIHSGQFGAGEAGKGIRRVVGRWLFDIPVRHAKYSVLPF